MRTIRIIHTPSGKLFYGQMLFVNPLWKTDPPGVMVELDEPVADLIKSNGPPWLQFNHRTGALMSGDGVSHAETDLFLVQDLPRLNEFAEMYVG